MAAWSGFTDEELSKLKDAAEDQLKSTMESNKIQPKKEQRKTRPQTNNRKNHHAATATAPTRKEQPAEIKKTSVPMTGSEAIKKTSSNKTKEEPDKEKSDQQQKQISKKNEEHPKPLDPDKQNLVERLPTKVTLEELEKSEDIKILTDKRAQEIQMTELEKLQKKQKQIEDENKLKRKMIKDTISERYKKAQAEASTLQTVQKELSRLDCLLANDVEILRSKIEEAAISFNHAQKKYEKAEKEFVDAKIDLQLKQDKKDQLTQHLYTIIQENELRKAKKLEELLGKLNMKESVDERKIDQAGENAGNDDTKETEAEVKRNIGNET